MENSGNNTGTSTNSEINTIGAFLKNNREKCGLSMEEVSSRTKINITMLNLLEDDKLKTLPSKAYVAGYVKAYCKELDIDLKEALRFLDKTYQTMDIVKQPISAVETFYTKENHVTNYSKHFVILIIVAIFFSFFYYLFSQDVKKTSTKNKIIRPETLGAQTPLLEQQSSGTVALPPVKIEKQTAAIVEIKSTPTAVATPITENVAKVVPVIPTAIVPAIIATTPPIPIVQITATPTSIAPLIKATPKATPVVKLTKFLDKTFEISQDPEAQILNKNLPESIKSNLNKNLENVFIQAVDGDTWLTYKTADKGVVKTLIKKGESMVIRSKEIRIFFGNINVTKIFYNNQLIKTPSVSGVKSLVFPTSAQTKYSIPLFIYKNDGTVETSDEYLDKNQATSPN